MKNETMQMLREAYQHFYNLQQSHHAQYAAHLLYSTDMQRSRLWIVGPDGSHFDVLSSMDVDTANDRLQIMYHIIMGEINFWDLDKWLLHREHRCQGVDGPCPGAGIVRRASTAYADDSKNIVTMCDSCFEWYEAEIKAMWDSL